MDPTTIVAFSKTIFNFVTNVRALKKLRKERDQLLALIHRARSEFEGARGVSRLIADEILLYQEVARASDEISRTMTELGTQLALDQNAVEWAFVQLELDRLRHSGPLNRLASYKNNAAFSPTPFKNDMSEAIHRIDMELSGFDLQQHDTVALRNRASAVVQNCDVLYRVRNRVVIEFATQLGNALRT